MKAGTLRISGIALSDWGNTYKAPRVVKGEVQFPLVRANRLPKPFEWNKRYRQARYSKATLKAFATDAADPYRLRNTIEYLAIYGKYLSDADVVECFEEWQVYADRSEDDR